MLIWFILLIVALWFISKITAKSMDKKLKEEAERQKKEALQLALQKKTDEFNAVWRQKMAETQAKTAQQNKLPTKVGSHPLQYQYIFSFDLLPGTKLPDVTDEISVSAQDSKIILSANGSAFGEILNPRKAEMVQDFQRCNYPVLTILEGVGQHVKMGFYRDRRTGNEWREQVVIPLVPYMTARSQKALLEADPDEELCWGDYSPNYEAQDVRVGEIKIGRLPDEIIKRNPYLIYLERVETYETQKSGTVYIPYVRLYFSHQNT